MSAGFYVMLCVLSLHFVFVYVAMFILGIVFLVSSISGLGFFGVVEFLFTVSCSCVVLVLLCGTCVACLVSAIYFCCPFSV